ncbi:MAG: ABC transporter permease subunit [Spirochaetales bacterium]|nr:ABC transporter permease subunit [Spirochaetales bacterium]
MSSSLIFSIKIILAVCGLNLVIGSLTGVYLARHNSIFSRIIDILVSLPMVFPPIAMGFFLLLVFGRNSFLGRWLDTINLSVIFSAAGVLLAAFIAGFPLMVKSVKTSASALDDSILEMAELQGASRTQIILYIIIPNIRMGIFSGLTLSSGRALGEVGMTLMLGGNIIGKTETISLAIYNSVFDGNFDRAMFLSVVLAVTAIILFMLIQRMEVNYEYAK